MTKFWRKFGEKDGEKKQDGEKEKQLGKDKVDKEIEEKEKEMAEKGTYFCYDVKRLNSRECHN